jgi:hypothetical protein
LAIEHDLVSIAHVLLCAVFFVHGFVAAPYVVVDAMHLMDLAEGQSLEDMPVSFVAVKAVAFFAKIVFTVSAVIQSFIEVISFDVGTLAPGAAAIETLATAVSSRIVL